jgi:hypothetical protein
MANYGRNKQQLNFEFNTVLSSGITVGKVALETEISRF